jgi:O-acetyl-ADP-ribose deacetylase (regulator of RNase III)
VTGRVTLVEGDITSQDVDAIVNPANSALQLGAGVAGAIRAKGGPTIQDECDEIGPIEVGEAAITGAGALPARFVIHAAGMSLGGRADENTVRSAARRSFALAGENDCATIAVPAIGAGIGGFSPQRCAEVLIEEARAHLEGESSLQEIRFVLLGEPMYRVFESAKDAVAVRLQMERMRRRP